MRRAGRFAVNVLGRQHEPFASAPPRPVPTASPASTGQPGGGGAPLLTNALASLECTIVAEHPAGDHWIVVGRVDDLRTTPKADPLLFYAGAFATLK